MSGWLKLHRKLLDSNMYKSLNSKQRDVLFSCLMLANYAENEWEYNGSVFKCNPGQFVTSLDSIAKNCGKDVKVQSVRTALLKLEKWGFLTNESTKTGRLISICKWDEYQQDEKDTNKDDNKDLTKSQQRSNKDLTAKEEYKEEKEIKKNKEELFFSEFKKITGKKIRVFDNKAKGQFKARLKEGYSIDDLIKAVENCFNDPYHKENPKYLTLEFITRADKLAKYLNSDSSKNAVGTKNRLNHDSDKF